MKNIYVVTHTQSIHHVEGKVGGWYNTGLTEHGKEQATAVARKLKSYIRAENPSITSSDLLRTKETAKLIADAFECKCQVNADLRETSYGVAEGKPQEWLDARIIPAPSDNRLDHISVEGAESKRDFAARIYRAVDAVIASDNPNQIIVTHGFALTFVIARWIGMPLESAGLVNFQNSSGGITHLQQDDFWNNRGVRLLNDTSHLTAPSSTT